MITLSLSTRYRISWRGLRDNSSTGYMDADENEIQKEQAPDYLGNLGEHDLFYCRYTVQGLEPATTYR